MFDNKHANQGSQCRTSVPTYTFVVHNVALYKLGGAQDDFCMFIMNHFRNGAQYYVVSLSVCQGFVPHLNGSRPHSHYAPATCVLNVCAAVNPHNPNINLSRRLLFWRTGHIFQWYFILLLSHATLHHSRQCCNAEMRRPLS